jgi:hypothetical protein
MDALQKENQALIDKEKTARTNFQILKTDMQNKEAADAIEKWENEKQYINHKMDKEQKKTMDEYKGITAVKQKKDSKENKEDGIEARENESQKRKREDKQMQNDENMKSLFKSQLTKAEKEDADFMSVVSNAKQNSAAKEATSQEFID